MNRLPASPLITRGLEIVEKRLGMAELSVRLGSPVSSIRAWQNGHATMPELKFLQLVDMLTQIDPSWNDEAKP